MNEYKIKYEGTLHHPNNNDYNFTSIERIIERSAKRALKCLKLKIENTNETIDKILSITKTA